LYAATTDILYKTNQHAVANDMRCHTKFSRHSCIQNCLQELDEDFQAIPSLTPPGALQCIAIASVALPNSRYNGSNSSIDSNRCSCTTTTPPGRSTAVVLLKLYLAAARAADVTTQTAATASAAIATAALQAEGALAWKLACLLAGWLADWLAGWIPG
jgi:hypothetical protein